MLEKLKEKLFSGRSFKGMVVAKDDNDPKILFLTVRVDEDDSVLEVVGWDEYIYIQWEKDKIPEINLGSTVSVTLEKYSIPYVLSDNQFPLYYKALRVKTQTL